MNNPKNNAPQTQRSQVAHLPGAKVGDKISDGRDYNVEFDDALMTQGGWRNPRDKGCKQTSLFMNRYSEAETSYQFAPPTFQEHVQHLAPWSQSWAGDVSMDQNPTIEQNSTTIFYGETIAGWQEDKRYPNVGPDFSYIFITKAYTFSPSTNDYFITELLDPDDDVFERVVKQDLRYGDKFSLQLLSSGVEHDLQDEYQVHWNRGLFSKVASYETCSEIPYSHPQQVTSIYLSDSGYGTTGDEGTGSYYGHPTANRRDGAWVQYGTLFSYNTDPISCSIITGSFTVEVNPDTWWWRRPQTSSFFDLKTPGTMAPSYTASGDLDIFSLTKTNQATGSLFAFMSRLMSKPHVYGSPGPNGQWTGSYFKSQQERYGIPPARKDLHIITFNNAEGCEKDIQTELQYESGIFGWLAGKKKTQNVTQALRHFGSISISPGSFTGVPNVVRGMVNHSAGSNMNVDSNGNPLPTSNPNYFYTTTGGPSFKDWVEETNYYQTPFTSGPRHTEFKYLHWAANEGVITGDGFRDPNQIFRPNWSSYFGDITGSGVLQKAPKLNNWTISKLEKRKNVIMADLNKQKQLFEGTGNSGFVIMPETLHPQIKTNLQYYLRKARLVDKGPRRKNLFTNRPRIIRRPRPIRSSFLNPFKFIRKRFKRFRWL